MLFKGPFSIFILIAFLVLITASSLLFGVWTCNPIKEGLDMVPIATDPVTRKLINGYYKVDDDNMAIVPYGFVVDQNDPTKILPSTKTAYSMLKMTYIPEIPRIGEPLPERFYFVNKPFVNDMADSSLAILPPNMRPNVDRIEFSGNPPKLLIYYNEGYVSETRYYNNKYIPNTYPDVLPEGVYYTDASRNYVSFLRYGQVADVTKGYGIKIDPKLEFQYYNYREVSNNYDVEFHSNEEEIRNRNTEDINFGEVRVRNQYGNIVILPRVETQSSTTVYQPGEFPFGASNYIPNYEDSVYLSSIGYRSMLGNVKAKSCAGICQAYNEFKSKMNLQCN